MPIQHVTPKKNWRKKKNKALSILGNSGAVLNEKQANMRSIIRKLALMKK